MNVIRVRKEKKGNKEYRYHEFTVRYSIFQAHEYERQEAILEEVGKSNLTEFIMSKILQDSLVDEIKTALREMLDSGQLVFNSNIGNSEEEVTGNNQVIGFLKGMMK